MPITTYTRLQAGLTLQKSEQINVVYDMLESLQSASLPWVNGATLPTSPAANQLFLHTPSGRKVLMLYTGGAWYPVAAFGGLTLYVIALPD